MMHIDFKQNNNFGISCIFSLLFHPSIPPSFPTSQCLNAVRSVQSLSCLDEADHTVGFLLQLSSFCKEWQFHLPKLLRDIQAGPSRG